jgi:hypothetical protein
MPQFLVAIQLPDNYDPSLEDEAMVRDIDVLQRRDGGCRCEVLRRRPEIGALSEITA